MEKGNKKIIRGWVMYDWANSVYNLVISSAIFPIFYDTITKNYFKAQYFHTSIEEAKKLELPENIPVTVNFFGFELSSSVLFSYVLSASFLVVSFLSPLLSGVADYSGNKKRFMQFFCYFGAIACMSLFFFEPSRLELGMCSVFFASIGFWNSLVFYNAFLPEIAEPKDHDKISARGFSMGYFGSMLLLIICLVMIQVFKIDARWCFVLVGLWWMGFSQFTYRVLPHNVYNKKVEKGILWRGFRELKLVYAEFKKTKRLKRFLTSFFFFNTGVQTVMLMAVLFAKNEIFKGKYEAEGSSGLIIAILLIQVLGALGAFIMSRLSMKIGNIKSLIISVSVWVLLCSLAYFTETPVQFYILASGVGLVMGGVQAVARSTYSKFLPETTDHASYFSFYDVTEKIGIVLGTFFFGFVESFTGSIRYSVISVGIFFVLGLLMLFRVPKEEISINSTSTSE
ncbi:MAG: MFS transporter [Bacteroidota bacterium]